MAQGGLNIPGMSRESAGKHRMAASHSPQMGNGLLAESLETSVPMFGEPPLLHHGVLLISCLFVLQITGRSGLTPVARPQHVARPTHVLHLVVTKLPPVLW